MCFQSRCSGLLVGVIAAVSCVSQAHAAIRYVNAQLAGGSGNGTSWANAYRGADGIAQALSASVAGDEIWVAAGAYRPTITTTRTASHVLKTGVAVYGGFLGIETLRDQRNPSINITVVTGDLLGNDNGAANTTDNSFHVFVGSGATSGAIVDGFTIQGGNANGANASDQDKGGGLIVVGSGSPAFRNCRFASNRSTFGGGAVYIFNAGASFSDCTFQGNVGGSFGGAADMNNGAVVFERCTFSGNTAARAGGCESYGGSQTEFRSCVFNGNSATGANGGGAIWIGVNSSVQLRSSTVVGNSATVLAGGFINTGGSSAVTNSILWANTGPGGTTQANQLASTTGSTVVSYSVVQGGYPGTQNLAVDPLFVGLSVANFRLAAGSPCIDSGINSLVVQTTATDVAGDTRFRDDPSTVDSGTGVSPLVDRGAYERQPPCGADLNWSGSVDGPDLTILLSSWGGTGPADLNGDGIVSGNDITVLLSAWGPC